MYTPQFLLGPLLVGEFIPTNAKICPNQVDRRMTRGIGHFDLAWWRSHTIYECNMPLFAYMDAAIFRQTAHQVTYPSLYRIIHSQPRCLVSKSHEHLDVGAVQYAMIPEGWEIGHAMGLGLQDGCIMLTSLYSCACLHSKMHPGV